MSTLPMAMKIVLNIIFFCTYVIVWILIENLLFWWILSFLGAVVPDATNPIHMQLAIITFILITVVTFVFRKQFYLHIASVKSEKKVFVKTVKKTPDHKKTKKKEWKNDMKVEGDKETDKEMEILIDKEIK